MLTFLVVSCVRFVCLPRASGCPTVAYTVHNCVCTVVLCKPTLSTSLSVRGLTALHFHGVCRCVQCVGHARGTVFWRRWRRLTPSVVWHSVVLAVVVSMAPCAVPEPQHSRCVVHTPSHPGSAYCLLLAGWFALLDHGYVPPPCLYRVVFPSNWVRRFLFTVRWNVRFGKLHGSACPRSRTFGPRRLHYSK